MAKKIISGILGLIFIVFVVCAVVVATYTLSSPKTDKGSESRLLITGAWECKGEDKKLEFFDDGTFKYTELESGDVIADGYFKIDEDGDKIKCFLLPGHHTSDFDDAINLYFFAQISYSDLVDPTREDEKSEDDPTCTFLIKNADNSSGQVLNCEMPNQTLDLYSRGKKFKAKNK